MEIEGEFVRPRGAGVALGEEGGCGTLGGGIFFKNNNNNNNVLCGEGRVPCWLKKWRGCGAAMLRC